MTKPVKLRRKILKQRGVELQKFTATPISIDELPAPFHKTPMMRLLEVKHKDKIQNLISGGTLAEVAKKLKIDPTTASKWRKIIRLAEDKIFWVRF